MQRLLAFGIISICTGALMAQTALPIHPAQRIDPIEASLESVAPAQTASPAVEAADHAADHPGQAALRASSTVSIVPLGGSPNVYTSIDDHPNAIAYQPELDALAFVHRISSPFGNSGALGIDRSVDGGATWVLNAPVTPAFETAIWSDVTGNRYPSCAIYNPVGNTDPFNAYVGITGPALSATTASWGYTALHSANLGTGAGTSEDYTTTQPAGLIDWLPASMVVNDATRELWSISGTLNSLSSPLLEDYQFVNINRGVFNPATNAIDWTLGDTIFEPNYASTTTGGLDANLALSGWTIAFSPDGAIGYAAFLGANNSSVTKTPQPIVAKTIDGGNTWKRLPSFDMTAFPALQEFLLPTTSGAPIPYWETLDGVVDENGRFHLFSRVSARSIAAVDSALLFWIGAGVQALAHSSVSNGSDWEVRIVDTVSTNSDPSAMTVGGQDHAARTLISRSQDGSKVFFAWTASDPNLVFENSLPNLFVQGYDVNSNSRTATLNATGATSAAGNVFWPSMAPLARETSAMLDYELPISYVVPTGGDLSPVNHFYLGGVGFNDADFGISLCNSAFAPNGLTSTFGPSKVVLRWNVQDGADLCQLEMVELATGTSFRKNKTGSTIHRFSIPLSVLTPGNTYDWRVRCSCDTTVPDVSAFSSEVGSFTVPLLKASIEDEVSIHLAQNHTSVAIRWEAWADGEYQVDWIDAQGRILNSQTLQGMVGTRLTVEQATQQWAPGIYSVILRHDGQRTIKRFAVAH